MYLDIRFANGVPVDTPPLEFHNPELVLDATRRRGIATTWKHRGVPSGKTVVLARDSRVVAIAHHAATWEEAIAYAKRQMFDLYARRRWPLPTSGVVTLMRPFPHRAPLPQIAEAGVDTIFSPERLPGNEWPNEQSVIDEWVGRVPHDSAHVERRAFVLGPWRAKLWEPNLLEV